MQDYRKYLKCLVLIVTQYFTKNYRKIRTFPYSLNSLTPKSVPAGAKKNGKSETLNSTKGIQCGNSIQTLGRSALRHGNGTGKWMPVGMTMPSKVAFVRITRDLPATFLYTIGTTPPSFVVFGLLF